MQGRRLPDGTDTLAPGDYGRIGGVWHGRPPKGHVGNLGGHNVVEHEDGTITVSPSILITATDDDGSPSVWHGYLERGVWRECTSAQRRLHAIIRAHGGVEGIKRCLAAGNDAPLQNILHEALRG